MNTQSKATPLQTERRSAEQQAETTSTPRPAPRLDRAGFRPSDIVALQRSIGNRAVGRLLRRSAAPPSAGPAAVSAPATAPIQRVSRDNIIADLNLTPESLDKDLDMQNVVQVVEYIQGILEFLPNIKQELLKYGGFYKNYKKGSGMTKGDVKRNLEGWTKKALSSLESMVSSLSEIEEWYMNANPSEAKLWAKEYLPSWRQDFFAFKDVQKNINTLFSVQSGLLQSGNIYKKGYGSISDIIKVAAQYSSGKTGGFSAKGRAHDIETEFLDVVPESSDIEMEDKNSKDESLNEDTESNMIVVDDDFDNLKEDNTFIKNIKIGGKLLDQNVNVYKREETENVGGPLQITGLNIKAIDKKDRVHWIKELAKRLSPVQTPQSQSFSTYPAAKDRGQGQYAGMGNTNARGYAYLLDLKGSDTSQWEWLHIRAASLGGSTDSTNLVLGTRDANTHMIPFEANIRTLGGIIAKNPKLYERLDVTWKADNPIDGSGAKHAYQTISIGWKIRVDEDSEFLPKGVKDAEGEATFDVLQTASMISKDEISYLEQVLKDAREGLEQEK